MSIKPEFIENDELYTVVRAVADLVFEYVSGDVSVSLDRIWMEDWREQGVVNPFYNQTETGLFLEFYYAQASALWTPWGAYKFGGSGCSPGGAWEAITPSILHRLDAREYAPVKVTKFGQFGPVYSLHRVDGLQLPEPRVRERQNYFEYEVVNQAWKNMTSRYHGRM